MTTVIIKGLYYHRTGWVNSNWARMLTAHDTNAPTALNSSLFQGTFNVQITEVDTFNFVDWTNGATETTWTVPSDVSEIRIHCYGSGGNKTFPTQPGGGGGYFGGTHPVTPGQVLNIEISNPGTGPRVTYDDGNGVVWQVEGGGNIDVFGGSGLIDVDDGLFTNVIINTGGRRCSVCIRPK